LDMTQPAYLSTLTPLRGIAALLVVVFHSGLMLAPLAKPETTHFFQNGWLWVDFFFVLSGFVLAHVYGTGFQDKVTWQSYRRYLGARFARVYPLHLVTLLIAAGLAMAIHAKALVMMDYFKELHGLHTVPASLLLMQSLHLFEAAPLNTPSWSLTTEWWVYVLFPFLVKPFFKLTGMGRTVILAGTAALFVGLMYYVAPHFGNRFMVPPGALGPKTINMTADFGYLRCLAGFLLGMLTYEGYRNQWGERLLKRGLVFIVCFGSILAAMHSDWHELIIVAFFPLVILSAACNADFVKQVLETNPLQRLGDWSFSIYMVHVLLIQSVWLFWLTGKPDLLKDFGTFFAHTHSHTLSQAWLICLGLVTVTLLLAALSYRFVEVPARHYLNWRFRSRLAKNAATV
jgi:peptidoglycan/LPS O-acetylase OafA/YrhL